jgi:hypothetical protein
MEINHINIKKGTVTITYKGKVKEIEMPFILSKYDLKELSQLDLLVKEIQDYVQIHLEAI